MTCPAATAYRGAAVAAVSDFGPFNTLAVTAHALYLSGDRKRAADACRAGLVVVQRAGDLRTERFLHYLAAIVLRDTGETDEAEHHVRALLDSLADVPDPLWEAKALSQHAELLLDRGRSAEAMDLIAAATRLVAAPQATYQHLSASQAVALALRELHLYEQSDAAQMQLLGHPAGTPFLDLIVLVQACLTRLLWGITVDLTGDAGSARRHFVVALTRSHRMRSLADSAEYPEMLARADAVEGFVLERLGEKHAARSRLEPLLEGGRLRPGLLEHPLAHSAAALIDADDGDLQSARTHLAQVWRTGPAQRDVLSAWALAVGAEVESIGEPRATATAMWQRLAQESIRRLLADRSDRFSALQHRIRVAELEEHADSMAQQALHDPLTGVGNRRMLGQVLTAAAGPACAVFIDVDRFKEVNDDFCHDVGDRVLVRLAELLRSHCRKDDVIVRYGGDEFVVLLAGDELGAWALADRVVRSVRAEPWTRLADGLTVSVSVGVSCAETRSLALTAADSALQRAKRAGRDRVIAG